MKPFLLLLLLLIQSLTLQAPVLCWQTKQCDTLGSYSAGAAFLLFSYYYYYYCVLRIPLVSPSFLNVRSVSKENSREGKKPIQSPVVVRFVCWSVGCSKKTQQKKGKEKKFQLVATRTAAAMAFNWLPTGLYCNNNQLIVI